MEFAKRQTFSTADHSIFAGLYQLAPMVLNALAVKPETIIKWHRAGFRSYWCWNSRCRGLPANCTAGDPRDEHCQSVVGRATDTLRDFGKRDSLAPCAYRKR